MHQPREHTLSARILHFVGSYTEKPLKEIAEFCGCSEALVSKVLREHGYETVTIRRKTTDEDE